MGDSNSTRFSVFSYVVSLFSVLGTSLRRFLLRILAVGPIPRHIAIIMDGNRRFADRSGMERSRGHLFGYDRLISTLENCMELGVKYVSVYAFSIDNFGRSREEVDSLMKLMEEKLDYLVREDSLLNDYGVKVQVLGDLSLLPLNVRAAAERAMAATKDYKSFVLNLCVSYTSTTEIVHSIQQVHDNILKRAPEETGFAPMSVNAGRRRASNGFRHKNESPVNGKFPMEKTNGDIPGKGSTSDLEIWGKQNADPALLPAAGPSNCRGSATPCACGNESPSLKSGVSEGTVVLDNKMNPWAMSESITVKEIENHLYTAGCPPPDILIRTSGETRLSNFMLWQCCSYSRLAFCKVMWPDFSLRHLAWIILDYQRAFSSLQGQRRCQEQLLHGADL